MKWNPSAQRGSRLSCRRPRETLSGTSPSSGQFETTRSLFGIACEFSSHHERQSVRWHYHVVVVTCLFEMIVYCTFIEWLLANYGSLLMVRHLTPPTCMYMYVHIYNLYLEESIQSVITFVIVYKTVCLLVEIWILLF